MWKISNTLPKNCQLKCFRYIAKKIKTKDNKSPFANHTHSHTWIHTKYIQNQKDLFKDKNQDAWPLPIIDTVFSMYLEVALLNDKLASLVNTLKKK